MEARSIALSSQAAAMTEIVRLCGLGNWVEQGYKQQTMPLAGGCLTSPRRPAIAWFRADGLHPRGREMRPACFGR
jgi:hypothetical protein